MTEPTTYPGNEQDYKGYHADWPQTVRELAGCWQELPQQEELRAGQRYTARVALIFGLNPLNSVPTLPAYHCNKTSL